MDSSPVGLELGMVVDSNKEDARGSFSGTATLLGKSNLWAFTTNPSPEPLLW